MTIASGQTATAADVLGKFVSKTGDAMGGALTLAGDPVLPLQAATKQYVDSSASVPNQALLKTGGAMTGSLILSAGPTADLEASTKLYVDTSVAAETTARAAAVSGVSNTISAVSAIANAALPIAGGTMTGALVAPISTSTATATGATTARTIAAHKGDRVTVKDFGAVGDGTTDDTTALAAAFASGIPVFMPKGKYKTKAPLTTVAGQIIFAESVNAYDDPATFPTSVPVVEIVADNSSSGFAASSAVLTLADRSSVRGVQITSVSGIDALSSSGRFITLERVFTRAGRYGCYLNGVGPQILACRFSGASSHGLFSDAVCTDGVFQGTFFTGNGGNGFNGSWCIKHTIIGCTFEWNVGHGMALFNANTCMTTGSSFDRNSGAGLRIGSCADMSFAGNTFRRNGVAGGSFPVHLSFQAGGLFGLHFMGNTYHVATANDDLSGGNFPAYTYQIESGATLTGSMFAERAELGTVGLFKDTGTSDVVRPQIAVTAEGTPGPYANDAAAQAVGIGVGSVYKDTAGILRVRVT